VVDFKKQLMRQMEKKINPKNDEFEKNRIHHLTIHSTTHPPFNLSTIQPINFF